MTAEEFTTLRKKQKLRLIDVAWIMGVTPRQVSRWQDGISPVPRSVELLLTAFAQDKINARWLVKNISDPIP